MPACPSATEITSLVPPKPLRTCQLAALPGAGVPPGRGIPEQRVKGRARSAACVRPPPAYRRRLLGGPAPRRRASSSIGRIVRGAPLASCEFPSTRDLLYKRIYPRRNYSISTGSYSGYVLSTPVVEVWDVNVLLRLRQSIISKSPTRNAPGPIGGTDFSVEGDGGGRVERSSRTENRGPPGWPGRSNRILCQLGHDPDGSAGTGMGPTAGAGRKGELGVRGFCNLTRKILNPGRMASSPGGSGLTGRTPRGARAGCNQEFRRGFHQSAGSVARGIGEPERGYRQSGTVGHGRATPFLGCIHREQAGGRPKGRRAFPAPVCRRSAALISRSRRRMPHATPAGSRILYCNTPSLWTCAESQLWPGNSPAISAPPTG